MTENESDLSKRIELERALKQKELELKRIKRRELKHEQLTPCDGNPNRTSQ